MTELNLERIKRRNEPPGFGVDQHDVRAMIDEIERLRKIENACISWDNASSREEANNSLNRLARRLEFNPRPGSDER